MQTLRRSRQGAAQWAGTGRQRRTHLALAEGGAVVHFVAAGALAQGLPATVDTGLLQEGHKGRSVSWGRLPSDMCPRPQ